MDNPSISVILPAYNCEKYIAQAVQSILSQSFSDFELLVIDDGSTDSTASVVSDLKDPRLALIRNERNIGLVSTLNRGISMASGKYIARMDGDDISVPHRFKRQFDHLENNPATGMVTSTADLIDEQDKPAGEWRDDRKYISSRSIRRALPANNCIVHPAVMIRSDLIKIYGFRPEQSQAEDYDLWLRLAADQVRIDKIDEPLLKHRILSRSFTRSRQQNVFWKNARTKLRFARHAFSTGRFNAFVWKTFFNGLADLAFGTGKKIKSTFKR
ncbi:MAG: glycosyltransferase [Chitinophagaceae bacterium]|nr:MAG: glycosyltransferase [Chitinophagaceae bacterium]